MVCGYVGFTVEVDGALFIPYWALDFYRKTVLKFVTKYFILLTFLMSTKQKVLMFLWSHPTTHLSYMGFSFSYVLFLSVFLMPIGMLPLL